MSATGRWLEVVRGADAELYRVVKEFRDWQGKPMNKEDMANLMMMAGCVGTMVAHLQTLMFSADDLVVVYKEGDENDL